MSRNIVGPFFGVTLGLTFLIVGILRILKSTKHNDVPPDHVNEQASSSQSKDANPNKHKTPIFIKLVAWSPAIPLCIMLFTQTGCDHLGWEVCRENHSFMEAMAYLGALGWIVSLPIAGMLKLVYLAARSD